MLAVLTLLTAMSLKSKTAEQFDAAQSRESSDIASG
jgi:hypothetical protein